MSARIRIIIDIGFEGDDAPIYSEAVVVEGVDRADALASAWGSLEAAWREMDRVELA